ncbi:cyclic nucleotide-binding domain-containing protein [Aggregicoccus sp. 17bor-14]|uniref:Crp/Fnr family transcriptional regulator n=1 Tax=Myxococcaceae TaxID=31 RepID=UPI00129CB3D5|nr:MULTISPECIES: cyclic nucleotide-binding domain-containing protein [Myxococcaceae]MBF5044667.1 cyclic nucleotide-binding domain-containing protein [Simulacricoccus sp. 17bor-14]MRI90411.1 cyclic nucleotide-binding domain-containing protein [Aggregicoccus sp. 17bor-14]
MNATLAQQVQGSALFEGLSPAQVEQLLAIAEEAEVARGRALFEEGASGDALYLVLSGELEILKKDAAGAQLPLARVGPGQVLGEMSLLGGSARRSATARALGEVRLLRLPTARFAPLLARDEVPALKLVLNLARVMSRRLLQMNEKLVEGQGARREELSAFQKVLSDWSF